MNLASYQVRFKRHEHRYLKAHLQHYHLSPKNQSDLSVQLVGKRPRVLLILQHRSRTTDIPTYRRSTLRDHPPTLSLHNKYLTTMTTQALDAASALSCDCDYFEVFARSLHCPMFSLFIFHFLIHICTYVIFIPLLAASFRFLCILGIPPFPAYLTTQDNWSVVPLVNFPLRIVLHPYHCPLAEYICPSSYAVRLPCVLWIHGWYSLSNYPSAVDSLTYTSSVIFLLCIASCKSKR